MCDKMAISAYILKIVENDPFLRLQMRAKKMFDNQSTYRLRRLENQSNKTTAADVTGRAQEFCWLLKSDLTRAV